MAERSLAVNRTTATSRTTATNRVAVRDMGTALRFDGVNDSAIATAGDMRVTPTQFRTFTGWIYPISNTLFLTKNTGIGDGLRVTASSSDRINIVWESSTTTLNLTTNAGTVPKKRWSHFAIAVTDTTTTIYINSVVAGTVSHASRTYNTATGLQMGRGYTGAFFAGSLDSIRVFNSALTATEIQNLYLHGAVPRNGLVAEYLFDEGTGTTAIDTSGNGNDGTITGATYTTDTPLRPRTSV